MAFFRRNGFFLGLTVWVTRRALVLVVMLIVMLVPLVTPMVRALRVMHWWLVLLVTFQR